jgi:hypothetical protein
MKPQIDWISLGVSDLNKSLVFYRDGLGLPTKGIDPARPGMVSFTLDNDQTLVIHEWALFSTFTPDHSAPLKPSGCIFNCYADSKEDVHQKLDSVLKAGGTQIGQVTDQPWGYVASVLDPNGHQWVLFYSPMGKM